MKKTIHSIFIWLIVALFISRGCGSKASLPTKAPDSVPTNITISSVVPSQTSLPTSTFAPTYSVQPPTVTPLPSATFTPFPTPLDQGPHWIANISVQDKHYLTVLDADGRDQRIIDLPSEVDGLLSPIGASPDGKWFAFHTGRSTENNLTLFVYSLVDRQVRKVAQVIAPDSTDRLYKVAEKIAQEKQKTSQLEAGDWLFEVQNSFTAGVHSFAWSPDSQMLAFGAQIDGPSSDLYLYDLKTSSLRRMVDDMQNVYHVQWSPDGKRLVLENAIPGEGGYTGLSLYIIEVNSPLVKNPQPILSSFWWGTEEWLSSNLLAIAGHGDGGPSFDLRALNINTGTISYLWQGTYTSYAYDPNNKLLAINGLPKDQEMTQYGLYLVSQNGRQVIGSKGEIWNLTFRGGVRSRFIASQEQRVFAIGKDGKISYLSTQSVEKISVSPDHRWLVLPNNENLEIFSETDQSVNMIKMPLVSEVLWRPDSEGFFFYSGKNLYYASIANFNPVLVPAIIPNSSIDLNRARWVP